MRFSSLLIPCLLLVVQAVQAQLAPEQIGITKLATPTDGWFLIKGNAGSHIFDGDSGEMQGLISHQFYTPAVVTLLSRGEAYHTDSWYSRGVRGDRTDVLTIVDMTDLTTKAEIDIPEKTGALSFRHHIGLLGDERHIVIFNMTPAQSVSIVDVVDREFDGEISTPGCAIIMPTGERSFMMICGDGRLQLIELDANGGESQRVRSDPFFEVETDPVFDQPVRTDDGWVLISHQGLVYEVTVESRRIDVSEPWSLLTVEDIEEEWRPGGRQPFTAHRSSSLLYALMHRGGVDTHHEPGSEVWLFDLSRKRRAGRLALEVSATHILSSQEEKPKLYVYDESIDNVPSKLRIYDGHRLKLLRTIDEPGPGPGLLQILSAYD